MARKKSKGYGHRKMYGYVPAKVAKDAPGMVSFFRRNKDEAEHQYNRRYSGPGDMQKRDASGKLGRVWGRVISTRRVGKAVRDYIRKNGGTRTTAKRAIAAQHIIRFGADPKNR